jgi:hypothetical protein
MLERLSILLNLPTAGFVLLMPKEDPGLFSQQRVSVLIYQFPVVKSPSSMMQHANLHVQDRPLYAYRKRFVLDEFKINAKIDAWNFALPASFDGWNEK